MKNKFLPMAFVIIFISSLLFSFDTKSETKIKSPLATVEMNLQKISEHVYLAQGIPGTATENQGFISNAAVIITKQGVVIFDALGTPSLGALLLTKIRKITDKPIKKVIISHYHADHMYGLPVFKKEGAIILAPEGYSEYLFEPIAKQRLSERRISLSPWVNENTQLISPDKVISENESFRLGNVDFEINYLGKAHSDGDLTLYIKQDKVLLSGDLIFEGRIPFIGNADTGHWLALLNKLDNSQLNALIPGHGSVAKDPNAAIKLTQNYLKTVRSKMQFAIDEMMSFEEAYESVDWSEFEDLPAFQAAHKQNVYSIFLTLEKESME